MWIGFIVISIVGTLLHFLYEISGHNKVVAIFAAVNESTWEHIKIALTPTFLWSLLDGFKYGASPNYFIAKSASLLVIVFLIPIIFYTYTAITKKAVLWFDITYFYVTIFTSLIKLCFTFICKLCFNTSKPNNLASHKQRLQFVSRPQPQVGYNSGSK